VTWGNDNSYNGVISSLAVFAAELLLAIKLQIDRNIFVVDGVALSLTE
jgi:hypothetical protein